MEIAGKTALITGAGGGIGRATALRLAKEGAGVAVSDVSTERGQESVRLIHEAGGKAHFVACDVSSEDEVRAMYHSVENALGSIDIIHNNAGVLSGPRFPDSAPDYWMRTIQVNLVGVLHGIHHGVQALRRSGGGVIINTASIAGLQPYFFDPVYAATKAAVVNLTRSLVFLNDEEGIRVNSVCPGLVRTDLDLHSSADFAPEDQRLFHYRRAEYREEPALAPDDIAAAVVKLITDDSLNGKCYKVVLGEEDEIV